MELVKSTAVLGLIRRTLNRVDSRLVDHGERVAWLVGNMLDTEGLCTPRERQDLCMLALLHDVGAYKTEEIDQMVQFETEDVWNHAIYGYLFLRDLSPLKDLAPTILFHHLDYQDFHRVDIRCGRQAQIIYLADRVDILLQTSDLTPEEIRGWLRRASGSKFDPAVVALFLEADRRFRLLSPMPEHALNTLLAPVALTESEILSFLKMIVFSIDFRSQFTVTHTVTTTRIAAHTAELLGLSGEEAQQIYYGALLHDLGKIGIPVEILEFPGKLSHQAMGIMRTHVEITEEILCGEVDETVTRIAVRHHEKLDGSGYPQGLCAEELTLPQRVVAVADIVSALGGTRSYKEPFPKEQTLKIVGRMCADGLLDPVVVDTVTTHFDTIMSGVRIHCGPVFQIYERIGREYLALMEQYN